MPIKNEQLEPLGNGIYVFVNQTHHFSTDTILLANFASPKKTDKAVELCSGCGTIPLIWARENRPLSCVAVEIQQEAAALLQKSLEYNKLQDKISILNGDLRLLKGKLQFGYYNLVVCNPPYKLGGSGIVNSQTAKTLARHESECTLDDVVKAAGELLQFGGRFCLCQRPERLTDILVAFRNNKIEPKRIRFVQQRQGKSPKLVLIEGKKGAKYGFMETEPTLFIEDEIGGFSEEMLKIYGQYKDG